MTGGKEERTVTLGEKGLIPASMKGGLAVNWTTEVSRKGQEMIKLYGKKIVKNGTPPTKVVEGEREGHFSQTTKKGCPSLGKSVGGR